jgi:uncharacterized protein (TIGR02145 family)
MDAFTDFRDSHAYKTVKIGSQVWMAENLAYMPHVGPPEEQAGIWVLHYSGRNVPEAKACEKYMTFGCLYDWETARQVAPKGWHLPTDGEWTQLAEFLEKDSGNKDVGEQLKSKLGWKRDCTDSYRFAGLNGSYSRFLKSSGGGQFERMHAADWWSSTESERGYAWYRRLHEDTYNLLRLELNEKCSISVRYVRD